MREWAENYRKLRTVRQETTMFKAGTLPLRMYATSVAQNEKVIFQTRPSEAPVDVDQNSTVFVGVEKYIIESNNIF